MLNFILCTEITNSNCAYICTKCKHETFELWFTWLSFTANKLWNEMKKIHNFHDNHAKNKQKYKYSAYNFKKKIPLKKEIFETETHRIKLSRFIKKQKHVLFKTKKKKLKA